MAKEKFWKAHLPFNSALAKLKFSKPVAYIYNPIDYAAQSYENYLKTYGQGRKKALFLGMNPGPFGMAQTGIPFGEVTIVRDWMKLSVKYGKLPRQHAKRPLLGLDCERSEVSGQRLWGLFQEKFPNAENFFKNYFVLNYCPLVFMEESARNITPDKLPAKEAQKLFKLCDAYLATIVEEMNPDLCIGVGHFAEKRLKSIFPNKKIGRILHPSPASPAANRGWAPQALSQLQALGLFK